MIDTEVFRTSRELGRSKLEPDDARNSFGYWIDIPSDWESYSSPENLILFLGIHLTHVERFRQIIEDLGPLSAEEFDWVDRYVNFYDRIARLLCTTGHRVDLKHDIAETLVDWRMIRKFVTMPCKVLDFGAGCGRQGTSAFLWDRRNIYTAVDATLAAYTLQNLVMSYMDTLQEKASFSDFLDFEKSGREAPDISNARYGDRFHIPTWLLAETKMPKKFFDVMIAAHVHNELSGPDFLRLIATIDQCLARDGVVYARSEQHIIDTRDYFDAVDLHGIEMVKELHNRGIVPVWCEYVSGYLTTVFARVGSSHYKAARKSVDSRQKFTDFNNSHDLSAKAGENYLKRCSEQLCDLKGKVALIGKGDHFYSMFLKPLEGKVASGLIISEREITGDGQSEAIKKISSFKPDAVAIASQQYPMIEGLIKQALEGTEFKFRQYYWYPVVILRKDTELGVDTVFEKPILYPSDLDHARVMKRK